jgi:hypothetical protein
MTPSYAQQYEKIIQAYFRDEIKPMDHNFCFCGTLSPDADWDSAETDKYPYSKGEYSLMEDALLTNISIRNCHRMLVPDQLVDKDYENQLFAGMCASLEVLKQIHISRGEIIDQTPVFTKRIVEPAIKR